ncbi:hypothetical protein SIO70_17490 [Chitinophaga sancti]|uniref:hypothetical protein n=1 Tax=Chitinophaga sancti TaxID=1004 RepID=UPI002A754777|nr:hypothetical protein [Chitinophaga sancti]WPQ60137.1 hypothetical protein SIO70_17490 [Chitinophaga sancti]
MVSQRVLISPGEYVKEILSGDMGYELELHQTKRIDSNIIGFVETISFIEYLRLCLKWAGLVGLERCKEGEIPDEIIRVIEDIRKKLLPF